MAALQLVHQSPGVPPLVSTVSSLSPAPCRVSVIRSLPRVSTGEPRCGRSPGPAPRPVRSGPAWRGARRPVRVPSPPAAPAPRTARRCTCWPCWRPWRRCCSALWQYGAWQHGREDLAAAPRRRRAEGRWARVMSPGRPVPRRRGRPARRPHRPLAARRPRSTSRTARWAVGDGVWAVTPVAVCDGGPTGPAATRRPCWSCAAGLRPGRTRPPPPAGSGRGDRLAAAGRGLRARRPGPRATTCCPSCGSPTPSSTSTRTSTAATSSREVRVPRARRVDGAGWSR